MERRMTPRRQMRSPQSFRISRLCTSAAIDRHGTHERLPHESPLSRKMIIGLIMVRFLELPRFFLHPYLGWLPSTLLLGHTVGIAHASTGQRAEVLCDDEQPAVYSRTTHIRCCFLLASRMLSKRYPGSQCACTFHTPACD